MDAVTHKEWGEKKNTVILFSGHQTLPIEMKKMENT